MAIRSRRCGRRGRATTATVAAFAVAVAAAGCVTPMMHPLRVPDGFVAEAAFSPIVFTGRHGGCDNEVGCTDTTSGEPGMGMNIHLSGGYGTVLADTFGIMGGGYLPAQDTLKAAVGTGHYSFFALWGWFTVQCPWAVLGVGPEIGVSGWALAAGAAVRPWGDDLDWSPELGVYGRLGRPYELEGKEFNGRVPAWEVGVRLQVEMIFLQYAYYRHTSGVMDFTIWETSVYTDTMSFITIGVTFSPDAIDLL